ncbi:MAG: hypothetical protein ACMUFK_04510, partial [Thermoplasmatota archaeon]
VDRFDFPEEFEKNGTIMRYLSDSGDYLLNHIQSSGKWDYEYEPSEDRNLPRYNILRHAGTTYSMALIFKYTRDPDYYNGTIRTLNYLLSHHLHFDELSGKEVAYMEEKGLVKLGGAALAVLAVVEVEEVDPLARYERELEALGEFILEMQHEDGSFQCFYKQKENEHSDYYPGEALLAIARLYDHTGNARYRLSLSKGLDFYNQYFGYQYTAYTPWATEAMVYGYSWTNETSYLDHCYLMAENCRSGQILPGPDVKEIHIGGWGSDPAANSASRVEGVVDSYLLARRNNDTERMARYGLTMEYSTRFLINLQYDEEEALEFPRPQKVKGGTPLSYNEDNIRIDYVQHAVVVMAKTMVYRGSDLNV